MTWRCVVASHLRGELPGGHYTVACEPVRMVRKSEMVEHEPESGVFFAAADCAGVWRRIVVDLIDVAVASGLSVLLSVAVSAFAADQLLPLWVTTIWLATWLGYFVVLKRSRLRTAGYRIGGVKVVDLHGGRPSLSAFMLRFVFTFFGPMSDVFWLQSDPRHQALRDKFTHTYVVRTAATPAGSGPITYAYQTVLAWTFLLPEVKAGTA